MGLTYSYGNLFDVATGIVAHGCNAQGVMGSGVAKTFKEVFPASYQKYLEQHGSEGLCVGEVIFHQEGPDIFTASAITQETYGRVPSHRYVSYDGVDRCFDTIVRVADQRGLRIHIPKIGAGLGNGDWKVVESIILSNCRKYGYDAHLVNVWEI